MLVAPSESPLAKLIVQGRRALAPLAATSFAMNTLALAIPLYSVEIFDRVLHSGSLDTLILLTGALLLILLAQGAFDAIRSKMMHRLGEWVEEELLPDVAQLPSSGPNGPIGDVKNLRAFLGGPGAIALLDLPWLPIFAVAAFLLHPAVGWFTLVTAALLLGMTVFNESVTRRAAARAATAQGAVMMRLGELSRKQEAAAGLSLAAPFVAREMVANAAANEEARRVGDVHATLSSMVKTARIGAQTLIMALAAILVLRHDMSSGGLMAASILLGRALLPIDSALAGWRQFQTAHESWLRLGTAFSQWSPAKGTALPPPHGQLSVEGATVVLPGTNRRLVEGVSFAVAPGSCVIILGPSGSGKSTLCRLLVGAIRPTIGEVRLDGAAIADWTDEQRRRHVGYLPQDLALFSGTVQDNIARFTDANDLDVVAAAARANCDDMIRGLPGGYKFQLADGGAPLSGGQRQRIALARALFGVPQLVVLDEPNSNLDMDGDAALAQTVRGLKRNGVTVILVTHRSALVEEADKIAIMNAGRLVHFGDSRETVAKLQSVAQQMRGNAPPQAVA